MSSNHESLFAGICPHEGIEGSDSQVLGAFIHFVETLHTILSDIPAQADLHQWFTRFMTIIDLLFEPIETTSHEIQDLREVIEQLERIGDHVVDSEKISFEVVHQYLVDSLDRSTYGTGFLTGAVTFCAMLPMRSIPAKVICLLGMQHDAFPQDLREPGFSLIAAEPRTGDRSKRDDDKYLFLEALMCSGRIFYISYIGRDIQDNAAKPPSVLVNELLEYVNEDLGIPIDPLITEHPLQPFSPDYFNRKKKRLFSYSKENQEASRLLGSIGEFPPFFSAPIGMPSESRRQCDLNQLARFFAHPIQFLMQQRLGIYFQQTTEPIADIESFALNPLDHFQASQYLLKAGKEGRAPEKNYRTLQASGQLPHGNVGVAAYEEVSRDVNAFVLSLGHFVPQSEPEIVQLEVELPPFQISGLLDLVYPTVRIIYRLAKLRPKDLLHAFIHHMAMASAPRIDLPGITFLICKDAIWEFGHMDNPKAILEDFLTLYWQGLQVPLPFFAKTSYAYAIKRSQGKKREVALTNAQKSWKGGYFNNGEFQDPYIQRCFAGENPLTPDFESLATRIFDPLFAYGKQLSASSIHHR
jgi:exodeoxyribonuclease V gamma subunit